MRNSRKHPIIWIETRAFQPRREARAWEPEILSTKAKRMKKNRIYPVFGMVTNALVAIVLIFLFMGASRTLTEGIIEKDFSLAVGERETIEFNLVQTGEIRAFAEWSPGKTELSLILFRPGQMNYIARTDGGSPAELVYEVTEGDTLRGSDWKLKVVNMANDKVTGHVQITYPIKADSLLQ